MILIDSNVLMYAAGSEHENKTPSVRLLDRIARDDVRAAIDAEVLQEVLHRYRAIRRWEDGRRVYDLARSIFPVVYPLSVETVDHARDLLDSVAGISARDALHAAVVEGHDLAAICSYDRGFDRVPGLRRLEPGDVA